MRRVGAKQNVKTSTGTSRNSATTQDGAPVKHRFHGLITFTKNAQIIGGRWNKHVSRYNRIITRFEKPIRMTTRPVEPLGGTVRCDHRMSSDSSVAREDGCCRSTVCRKTIASSRLKRSAATAASSAQSAGQSQSTR